MTLTIRKLSTRCRAPRTVERPATLVEAVARGLLASELNAQLGPSLNRLPAVIRLKTLRVRLSIPARNLDSTSLAAAWARAFTLAIHRALAYPSGDGVIPSRRHSTDAAYRASLLHHIATRGLEPCWEFPELQALGGASPSLAAFEVLLASPASASEILLELDRNHWLELVLAIWDEPALEQIMQALAATASGRAALSLEHLIQLAQAAAAPAGLHAPWPLSARRQALRLWLRSGQRLTIRAAWHGLRLLRKYLEIPALLFLRDPGLLADPIPFPQWCKQIVLTLPAPDSHPSAQALIAAASAPTLPSVLNALRPLVPSAATPSAAAGPSPPSTWIASDYAGILLMLPIIRRLDLPRFCHRPEFLRFGGVRAFSFFLAGLGMSLLNRFSLADPLEPSVAILAGMFPDPDLGGMRQFFSFTEPAAIADFAFGITWPDVLDHAATELSQAFAARVRGFRKASRDAVFRQFVRIPGRILVEDSRLLVTLNSNPWAVALHISGIDDPLDRVEWHPHRRVEYVLEGL